MIKNFLRIALVIFIPLLFAVHGPALWDRATSFFDSFQFEELISKLTSFAPSEETSEESPSESVAIVPPVMPVPQVMPVPPAMPVPSESAAEFEPPSQLDTRESGTVDFGMQEPLHWKGKSGLVPSMPKLPEPAPLASEADTELAQDERPQDLDASQKTEEPQHNPIVTISKDVGKGETFSEIVDPLVSAAETQRFVSATKGIFSFSRFRAGQPYVVVYDDDKDRLLRFEYEINRHEKLVIEDMGEDEKAKASLEEIVYDKELALVENTIVSNLFLAMEDVGEAPQLALVVANLFAWDINFIRDIQLGDSFSILVEKLYREGEFKGYGKTLGATFTNSGKKYEAYRFVDSSGKEAYYGAEGKNLKKVLLQSPLSFTRVTSGYTRSRKHPIFGDYRAHLGIDYGAPHGTPIMAVGDGVVTRIGWVGGYGRHIVIRHNKSLESLYSHMSRYAKGLKKGSKVSQGQVIAYVGSTGYSTGPHLDFRLRQDGKFINPAKAITPRAEEVAKKELIAFKKQVEVVRAYMEGERSLASYTAQSE